MTKFFVSEIDLNWCRIVDEIQLMNHRLIAHWLMSNNNWSKGKITHKSKVENQTGEFARKEQTLTFSLVSDFLFYSNTMMTKSTRSIPPWAAPQSSSSFVRVGVHTDAKNGSSLYTPICLSSIKREAFLNQSFHKIELLITPSFHRTTTEQSAHNTTLSRITKPF